MSKPLAKLVTLLKPKRRWAQFSLKSLLVLTAVIGIGLGGFSYRYVAQQRVISAIREMGGDPNIEVTDPGWLRRLIGDKFFERVVGAELQGARITDETLEILKVLRISIPTTGVTDQGVKELQRASPTLTVEDGVFL